MSTHTPAPWPLWHNEKGAFVIGPDSAILCQRNDWEHRAAESIANGRLMAASPDLLVAAKKGEELRQWILEAINKAIYEQQANGDQNAWRALAHAMYDGTMASYTDAFAPVIAKAEGGGQ